MIALAMVGLGTLTGILNVGLPYFADAGSISTLRTTCTCFYRRHFRSSRRKRGNATFLRLTGSIRCE